MRVILWMYHKGNAYNTEIMSNEHMRLCACVCARLCMCVRGRLRFCVCTNVLVCTVHAWEYACKCASVQVHLCASVSTSMWEWDRASVSAPVWVRASESACESSVSACECARVWVRASVSAWICVGECIYVGGCICVGWCICVGGCICVSECICVDGCICVSGCECVQASRRVIVSAGECEFMRA